MRTAVRRPGLTDPSLAVWKSRSRSSELPGREVHIAGSDSEGRRRGVHSMGGGQRGSRLDLAEAQDCIDAGLYAEADELLRKVLALDLRCLDAHALLGERNIAHWPTLALRHFELGVAIGSLSVEEDFEGELPWSRIENRPFLRCLLGLSCSLFRLDRREPAAQALRWLVRLDPADRLAARPLLAAIEAGKTWREMETDPDTDTSV